MKRIVVDGNDGLGKSTLVKALRALDYNVTDRGIPTKMTDDLDIMPRDDEFYLILDGPIELSRARLAKAGKDLGEKYHTLEDLTHYRTQFQIVAQRLTHRCVVLDASGTPQELLALAISAIQHLPV